MVFTTRRVLSPLLVLWVLGVLGVPAAFAQAPSVVHAFDGVTAGNPAAGLTLGVDGFLYGTTEAPLPDGGVFRVRPNGTGFQVLHTFALPAGIVPSHGALARGPGGVFYGTTLRGGANQRGTVYRLETGPFGATVTTLHDFAAVDANPDGGVILASDGLLYGAFGDDATAATVYRLATDGTGFQHLRQLPNGLRPAGTLLEGSDGLLYGATERGGANDGGTVFRLNRDGTAFATLVELEGRPVAGLTEAPGPDGTPHLFGVETTGQQQVTRFGAIFQLQRSGAAFVRLSAFTASDADGDTPRSPLLLGRDGALYGTTTSENIACPPENCGTVFRVTPSGRPFSLFTLPRVAGGAPMGALVQGPDGTLYGTARVGGPDATAPGTGHGVVFAVPAPDRVPLALTGPTISDEGGEAVYTLTLRNTTNHTLAGPLIVNVTPSPGLVLTDQSADGWSCTQPQAVGLLCVWPTELPAGVDSDAHTLRFTLAPPFSLNCGTGPSPCVSLLATVYDYGAAASALTAVRALVGGTFNTPPVPQDDTVPVYGTATAVIRVLDNDADPDGDALRVTRLLESPRFGAATINADGTITYTPTDTLPQPDSLRYEVSDERVPTAAAASAVVTLTPSVPPLTASKTRLDLGPLAPRRIATGRFSLRSPGAMEVRIELQPVTAAEIATALQSTAYDPAQAVSDPDAFRSDGRLSIDPLYSSAYVVGVHYQAPPSVGRVSVARVQIIGEPPGLAPVTRSLLIVASSADPATAPLRAVDDTAATPVQTTLWYDVLANDGGVSVEGRPLYVSMAGCMSAFRDTDCFVPANMAATGTLPASITGPQDLGFATTTTVTGTATGMYAVSELDACVGAPQPGACQLEGNMYYGYLSVEVGGTPPDLSLTIAPATQTVAPGDVVSLTATVTNPGPGMASRVTVSGFADLTRLTGLVVTPSQGTCAIPAPGAPLTCTLRSLVQGASATITLQGTAPATLIPAGQTSATLDITAAVTFGNADAQPGDNTAQARIRVTLGQPDLRLVAVAFVRSYALVSEINVGETVEYAIGVTNAGDVPGTFTVTTELPTGLTLIANSTCTAAGQSVTCSASLDGGANPLTIPLALRTDVALFPPGQFSTTLALTSTIAPAFNPSFRSATASLTVRRPNVRLVGPLFVDTQGREITEARVGDIVEFRFGIENTGDAPGPFTVTIPLPAGVVTGTQACGTSIPTAQTVICSETAPARYSGVVPIRLLLGATLVPVGQTSAPLSLTATVDPADDPAFHTVTASLTIRTVPVPQPDVRVMAASFLDSEGGAITEARVGDVVEYRFGIANTGDAPGPVTLTIPLPAGVSIGTQTCAPSDPTAPALTCALTLPPRYSSVISFRLLLGAAVVPTGQTSAPLSLTATVDPAGEPAFSSTTAVLTVRARAYTPTGQQVTTPLTDSAGNPQPITVTFTEVVADGITLADPTLQAPGLPANFSAAGAVYEITTTATVVPPIIVCFSGTFTPADAVLHFENGAWVQLPNQQRLPVGSIPFSTICAETTSLSPFVVASLLAAPPTASAGDDQVVEATWATGAAVTLTGAGTDTDGDALSFTWSGACGMAGGARATLNCPIGASIVTLTVTDVGGLSSTDEVQITVRDTTPPAVTCGAADAAWRRDNAAVTCRATDQASGVAPADVTFTLSTSVVDGDESAAAMTTTRQVCDLAGNCTQAGPVGPFRIDRLAPAVAVTAPADGAVFVLNRKVAAGFTCADGGSGVRTCTGTTPNAAFLDTSTVGAKTFTVTATDAAGNEVQVTRIYAVQFAGSGRCLVNDGRAILPPIDADGTSVFPKGVPALARFRVCDANGRSVGTPGVVSAFKLVQRTSGGVDQTLNQDAPSLLAPPVFQWDRLTRAWTFAIDTRRLAKQASYRFTIQLADGTSIPFGFGVR